MKYLIYLLLLGITTSALGQKRDALEAERSKINQTIAQTNKKLSAVQKDKQKTNAELKTLQRKIKTQEQEVASISLQVQTIDQIIEAKDDTLQYIATHIDSLYQAYAQTTLLLYKYKRTIPTTLAFFSPEYWEKTFRLRQYLAFFEQARRQQLAALAAAQNALLSRLQKLKADRNASDLRLKQELSAKNALAQRASQQNKIAQQLSAQEKNLRNQVAQAKKTKQQLSNKIQNVIRDEMANARQQARTYTPPSFSSNKSTPTPAPTPEPVSQLHKSFAAARGKLAAPARGTLHSDYGRRPHPDLPLVTIENNGIDIKTAANAAVNAIYDGTVVSIFTIPGMGNAVMVKHGDFYTTYAGLHSIKVRKGQTLKTQQALGLVSKDAATGLYLLHFEIWRNKQKENPRHWVRI